MAAYGPDPDDPGAGLAAERTELAWDRSGLAVFVCAAVLLRRAWPLDSPGRLAVAAAIGTGIALWATVVLLASRRAAAASRPERSAFRRMTLATLVFAVAAFAVGFFPPT